MLAVPTQWATPLLWFRLDTPLADCENSPWPQGSSSVPKHESTPQWCCQVCLQCGVERSQMACQPSESSSCSPHPNGQNDDHAVSITMKPLLSAGGSYSGAKELKRKSLKGEGGNSRSSNGPQLTICPTQRKDSVEPSTKNPMSPSSSQTRTAPTLPSRRSMSYKTFATACNTKIGHDQELKTVM